MEISVAVSCVLTMLALLGIYLALRWWYTDEPRK